MADDIGLGYDRGYRDCPCFWGTEPSNLVVRAASMVVSGSAIDVGCGEGKNAAFLARQGFRVQAVDGSSAALLNARTHFGGLATISWEHESAETFLPRQKEGSQDIAVSTGVAHCLRDKHAIESMIRQLALTLREGGILAFASFNDTLQDLRGHEPEFSPTLLSHVEYLDMMNEAGLRVQFEANTLLSDIHPHIGIRHMHSITRILGIR
jgi:2-polyprenyl-3-methyl-5-hydroxy-6-metoxy-1,4-benzoquinol methylase